MYVVIAQRLGVWSLEGEVMTTATILWSGNKQAIVAFSSTEGEYRGVAIDTCEELWIGRLLTHLGECLDGSITIWCDNMSSIQRKH